MNRLNPIRTATYQDILDAPAGMIAQIVSGALYTQPRPASPHALAESHLSALLISAFNLGITGPGGWTILVEPELHLEPSEIYVPDLAGWRRETMPEFEIAPYFTTRPDWVCEILSPSTRRYDLTTKRDTYARQGVSHLWFVDPEARTLEAFSLQEGSWRLDGAWAQAAEICTAPFEALPFELSLLWPKETDDT